MNNSRSRAERYSSKQQKRQSTINFFEGLLRGILSVIIVIAIVATFISAIVNYRIYNTSGIVNAVLTPEYYSLVMEQVDEAVEDSCLQLGYDKEEAMKLVDESQVNYMAGQYISATADKLLYGSSEELPQYPRDEFKKAFDELFDKHEKETGEVIDEDTRTYYVELFAQSIETAAFLTGRTKGDKTIAKVYDKTHSALSAFREFRLIMPITLALLLVYYFSMKRSTLTRVYRTASVAWVGTSLVFIPALMADIYNLPARLPLLDSPSKSLITSLIDYFVSFIMLLTSSVWVITTIVVVVCIIMLVRRPYKHHRSRRRRDYNEDEEYDVMEPMDFGNMYDEEF